MHIKHIRQADLNLLVVFTVLAEERNISRAAKRLFLSQPAVSRAFGRLQTMFGDQLMVRGKTRYELTPKGSRILRDLEEVLPKIDRLLRENPFDPAKENVSFTMICTDYGSSILGPPIFKQLLKYPSKVTVEFVAWHKEVFKDVDQGQIDIIFRADDGIAPAHWKGERLFEEEMICVVSEKHDFDARISFKDYINAKHVVVSMMGIGQHIPDNILERKGIKRKSMLTVPYFSTAVEAVSDSDLIATVPKRLALKYKNFYAIRLVEAPEELQRFSYLMCWHPRLQHDVIHAWLREQILLAVRTIDASDFEG